MAIRFLETDVFPCGMAPSDEDAALRTVEACGRTAYKSEDKITEDSARAFVLMLKKHGHLSVLEHSNIALRVASDPSEGAPPKTPGGGDLGAFLQNLLGPRNAYHRLHSSEEDVSDAVIISGNIRAWVETLDYLRRGAVPHHQLFARSIKRFFPVLFEAEEVTGKALPFEVSLVKEDEQLAILKEDLSSDLPVFIFKIVCDRGITHEIVRHRVLSFTQESTRYVNYKNKGMTLILPEELQPFYDPKTQDFTKNSPLVEKWKARGEAMFEWYQEDLVRGLRPEIARDILPNLLKSEIFVSGRWSGWKHFLDLRDSRQAHPRIRYIAGKVRSYFDSIGLSGGTPG